MLTYQQREGPVKMPETEGDCKHQVEDYLDLKYLGEPCLRCMETLTLPHWWSSVCRPQMVPEKDLFWERRYGNNVEMIEQGKINVFIQHYNYNITVYTIKTIFLVTLQAILQ